MKKKNWEKYFWKSRGSNKTVW